jgi:hypothetical protein
MSKQDKKIKKIEDAIAKKEADVRNALGKKSSSAREINLPAEMRAIADLKSQLAALTG